MKLGYDLKTNSIWVNTLTIKKGFKLFMFKLFLITAIRHVYESCDDYSMCEKNSECKEINNRRTCQCHQGYEFLDSRCIKGIIFWYNFMFMYFSSKLISRKRKKKHKKCLYAILHCIIVDISYATCIMISFWHVKAGIYRDRRT